MGIHRAEQSIEIGADAATCFSTIVDYESFPRWQEAVKSITILSRHDDGLGRDVRVEVDARFREVTYTLRYSYEPPHRVRWDYVEGDVAHVEGSYELAVLGEARTRATYRLGIDPGVPVPGLVVSRLNRLVMKRSVEDLRSEAERRAALRAPAS